MPKRTFAGARTYKSSVVIGNPEQHREAGWQSHTKARFAPEGVAGAPEYRRVRKDPNKSNVPLGGVGGRHPGRDRPTSYLSVNAENFSDTFSVRAGSYRRARPAPGFDRQTANRTNYELGTTATEYVTTIETSTQNPKELPSPGGPEFADIGVRDYNPHNCAGYKHNLVSGTDAPHASQRPLPGRFKSNDKDIYGKLVGGLDEERYYDLTVGRTRKRPQAPPTSKERDRSLNPPLDSLMALRPPLESDYQGAGLLSASRAGGRAGSRAWGGNLTS